IVFKEGRPFVLNMELTSFAYKPNGCTRDALRPYKRKQKGITMLVPIQVSPIDRRIISEMPGDSRRSCTVNPSCDPATQITCGAGCCNPDIAYCLAGKCQPYV